MQKPLLALYSLTLLSSYVAAATLSKEIQNPSLIVYNSNLGVVHEQRALSLSKTDTSIHYEGVASSINTDSIKLKLPQEITLHSQQYRFDKLTQAKLLEAHIGKKVSLRRLKNAYEHQVISATLLAHSGDEAIVKTIDYQILTVKSSSIIFETIPKELITKPSLVWNISTQKEFHNAKLELDYLISNISFKSDYVLSLDKNSSNLTGWISINNRSGKSFHNTKLSLLAGDINRVSTPRHHYKNTRVMALQSAPEVSHQAHEGYHFYDVPFKVTLANNEKTQIKFISKNNIQTKREYKATLSNPLYLHGQIKSSVSQYVTLDALELPLPKGVIRTYSKLQDKNILLGETEINHTPKNQKLSLKVGENFDISLKQTLLKREDRTNWLHALVEYSLTNNSDEPKEITLLVPFNKNASSKIQTDMPYSFTKGNFVTFSTLVSPNATKKFTVGFESKK